MTDVETPAALLASYARFTIEPGLTETELAAVEKEFAFSFADDHRAFLTAGLPTGRGWPDWRHGDRTQLRDRLAAPVEGVLFDVASNGFWYEGWGPQPVNAVPVAKSFLVTAPRLIPLYSHRYLPAGRGTAGHPVLSVMQTDVIVYGADLKAYLRREFEGLREQQTGGRPTVAFWKDLV
ncbi:hypothetical protein [Winogradskya humida]|uniref:SMI1/KNR4 family protein n=1 Tax=Winogradskya humida TaxID=113566 RepID=A0ABQ3ZU07_9ACTN|nr:hypothetical protein [Actinoplanes humidus]GIE22029.1 hypothetical protein Ahu01nite_051310 [Actinoplanes humidus]